MRDYRIHTQHQAIITGGPAFNIKAESLRLGNFSETEVAALWQQHTDATGQTFAADIFPELWQDTRGQPWLVNALGYQLTWRTQRLRDPNVSKGSWPTIITASVFTAYYQWRRAYQS